MCLVIQEGLPTPATGWQPKRSYTFKIPSRKEHIGRALSYLVSVVTWDLSIPVSAPSSSEAALSTSLLCTVAPSTGCQCWQNSSQCRHSCFQIDCASHTPARLHHGSSAQTAQGWQHYLDRVFLHLFSRHSLCTAKGELLRDSTMLPHKCAPSPVPSLLSVTDGATVQGNSNEQNPTRVFSARQGMQTMWQGWGGLLLQTACTITLLFSLAVTEQTEGCLDWPEFPSVLCNIMGAHQLPTQTSLILLPCSLHTWHSHPQLLCETLHCLFHPSPRPTSSKITARKLLIITFAISGKKLDMFALFFSYRQTLNSCFSE